MKNNKNNLKYKAVTIVLLGLIATGCSTLDKSKNTGGYYQDDGPGGNVVDFESIPNATPRNEPYSKAASRPYRIKGQEYVPLSSAKGFVEAGQASWYGKKYHGRKTSIGEVYDMYAMTAAHKTLPIPSYARVTSVKTNKSIIVRVNDRGPFIGNRIIDLSYVAAQKLGVVSAGTGKVIVESISLDDSQVSQPVRKSVYTNQTGSPEELGEAQYSSSYGNEVTGNSAKNETGNYVANTISKPTTSQNVNSSRAVPTEKMLQVGAFSVAANAQRLKSKLLKEGYAYTSVEQKRSLYKVVLGPYSDGQLSSIETSLKNAGYSVIVINQ